MPFLDTLIEMRNGGVAIDATTGLEDVVAAVRATGKKGKLTIILHVEPADKGPDIDTIYLRDDIKVDAPKPPKKQSLFFAGPNNSLSRQDIRQMNILDGVGNLGETIDVKADKGERK